MQAEVTAALRNLIRSQRLTFQGDRNARIAARQLNRALLEPAMNSDLSAEERTSALLGARQAAHYFRTNVLQGVQKDDGSGNYALRIHSETALGDNDTIKQAKAAPSLADITSSMNSGSSSSSSCDSTDKPVRRRRRTNPTTASVA